MTKRKIISIFCMFLCAIMVSSLIMPHSRTYAEEQITDNSTQTMQTSLIYGDTNQDGEVDSSDATASLKYDAGIVELNEDQLNVADVNGDNAVDSLDASMMLKYDAGLLFGLYPCPDFSKYETYTDADGAKTIKLLTKEHEKKYVKYNYDDLGVEEMWRLVNDTFYMFREFDRIVIDLNQFGTVEPLNEDIDNASLFHLDSHAKVTITRDGNEVVKWYARYKPKIETDSERIKAYYERNIRTIKDGVLIIDKASLCDFIDHHTFVADGLTPNDLYLFNRANIYGIYEICLLRIWYYLGMPRLALNDYSSTYPSVFQIASKETDLSYDPNWVIDVWTMPANIHFQKDGELYDILSVDAVFGDLNYAKDGQFPELPIAYIKEG